MKEETVLFILLRAGLWEKEPDDLSLFPLSGESWRRVFDLAKRQTVAGIVYNGLCRLPDEMMPTESLLMRWVAEVDGIEMRNRRMNAALAELYTLFGRYGLNPVLLKGQGVALFYGQPLLRACGDIDLYFPSRETAEQALEVIKRQVRTVSRKADGSIHYRWRGMEVEHHPWLLDMGNPSVRSYLDAKEQEWGYEKALLSPGSRVEVTVPSPQLNLLLLNTHIMKHAMGWGIGLRQLCDMARACHCLHSRVDADDMQALCRRAGIGKWSRLLHAFLTDYLGLAPELLPYPTEGLSSRPLYEVVMKSGNFGRSIRGGESGRQPMWRRKMDTSLSFLRHLRFSGTYMPKEAFWCYAQLLTGQFRG